MVETLRLLPVPDDIYEENQYVNSKDQNPNVLDINVIAFS